jgi:c-di-AMP phosphodiesterase-like protein
MKIDWEIAGKVLWCIVRAAIIFIIIVSIGTIIIIFLPSWSWFVLLFIALLGLIAFLMYKVMLQEKQWEARRVAYSKKYDGEIQERKKKAGERSIIV